MKHLPAANFSSEDLRLLAEVAFHAIRLGDLRAASTIFSALSTLKPGHPVPVIGSAMVLLAQDCSLEAIEFLKLANARQGPKDPDITAMLGWLLNACGRRAESVTVLKPLLEQTEEEQPSAALARKLLGSQAPSQPLSGTFLH